MFINMQSSLTSMFMSHKNKYLRDILLHTFPDRNTEETHKQRISRKCWQLMSGRLTIPRSAHLPRATIVPIVYLKTWKLQNDCELIISDFTWGFHWRGILKWVMSVYVWVFFHQSRVISQKWMDWFFFKTWVYWWGSVGVW